jgi:hypothetical protein
MARRAEIYCGPKRNTPPVTNNVNEIQTRWRYHFIHNVYAHFFNDLLDYFSTYLYPRFEYTVVGTYDKAVEYLEKCQQYERETDKPLLPALILNPSGEFDTADANSGGRQLWRYPNLSYGFNKRLFNPVYQDENLLATVSFIRMKGEVELLMLLNSFYEYCDIRMLFINIFGGRDRIIYPRFFSSFIIIPQELIDYEYTNEYTGLTYRIDWEKAGAESKLVRSTARDEIVIPCRIKPQISMVSLGDGSQRYGGADRLADWRLTATINYEVEIPNYFILQSDYLALGADVEIRYGSTFSANNDYQPPINRWLYDVEWELGLDATSDSRITVDPCDSTADVDFIADYLFKIRYFHEVTQAEIDSTSNLTIILPETITEEKKLIVNSHDGALDYGDHYTIENNGQTLIIRTTDTVHLKAGWLMELYVYEENNA